VIFPSPAGFAVFFVAAIMMMIYLFILMSRIDAVSSRSGGRNIRLLARV